jgi:uncharacterized membrane protein
MTSAFAFWKTVHVLSAAILFGTGIGTAFFCWFGYQRARRCADLAVLRSVLRFTVLADACFTAPAVVLQPISGLVLMNMLGWPLVSAWSIAVGSLFVFIGACWLPVVVIQFLLKRESERASSVSTLPARFHRRFQYWFVLGVPAFVALVVLFYLMIAKPLAISGV